MKKIIIIFTVVFVTVFLVTFSQESVSNAHSNFEINSKKEQKQAKKEIRKSKKDFFNNFYNPELYEDIDKVIVKDTVIRTTVYVYDISNVDYFADDNLTISEKESIRSIANILNNNNFFFDKNSYLLQIENADFILEVLKILQENPTLNLMIEGYTCDFDTEKQNRDLAIQRARAVSNLFVLKGGHSSRLKTVGFIGDESFIPNENFAVRFKVFR